MLFLWILLSCSGVSDSSPPKESPSMGQRPEDTTSTAVIPITSAADFSQAQARLLALAGEAEHAHITLAAGVYAQSLSLGMGSLPVDITVEGTDGVWFDGAQMTVRGRNIRIADVGFKGRTQSRSLVSITASEHASLANVRVVDAKLSGSTVNIVRSSEPPKSGERRRPARGGKRSRPAYIASISADGPEPVRIEDVEIVRTTIHTDALIQVGAPHASEVIIRDLVAPDLREKTAVSVSPSSLKITR